MNIREKLITLSILKKGNWKEMYDFLIQDKMLTQITENQVKECLKQIKNISVLTILDPEYPECYKEMPAPPFVLYYKGNPNLLEGKRVALIGNQRPSQTGIGEARKLGFQLLDKGITLVGNLQLGIETVAHSIATKEGKTIAILPSGFWVIYPRENYDLYYQLIKGHLVLTEYPPGVSPSAQRFNRAHHLLQVLSDVLIVIEMTKGDYRLNSLKGQIDVGKVVYALPASYNVHSSRGCLELIRYGAHCFLNCSEIFSWLNHM